MLSIKAAVLAAIAAESPLVPAAPQLLVVRQSNPPWSRLFCWHSSSSSTLVLVTHRDRGGKFQPDFTGGVLIILLLCCRVLADIHTHARTPRCTRKSPKKHSPFSVCTSLFSCQTHSRTRLELLLALSFLALIFSRERTQNPNNTQRNAR